MYSLDYYITLSILVYSYVELQYAKYYIILYYINYIILYYITLTKIIKRNTFVFAPIFHELNSKI